MVFQLFFLWFAVLELQLLCAKQKDANVYKLVVPELELSAW